MKTQITITDCNGDPKVILQKIAVGVNITLFGDQGGTVEQYYSFEEWRELQRAMRMVEN